MPLGVVGAVVVTRGFAMTFVLSIGGGFPQVKMCDEGERWRFGETTQSVKIVNG